MTEKENIKIPNSFEGVENYLINTQDGNEKLDISVNYWFHDSYEDTDKAYEIYFSGYRYIRLELDYYNSTSLWARMNEINSLDMSSNPFPTMNIDMYESDGHPKVELQGVKYFRFFIQGLAYMEVASNDFSIKEVDVDQLWSDRNE